jgi:hypothetical protein
MKRLSILTLFTAAVFCVSFANAGEKVKSGLQAGKPIGAFYVTKVAGAEEDGVKVGDNLCYRCRNGARPQVMVFTRSTDKNVVKLIESLDKVIASSTDQDVRAFVNILGENKDEASESAAKFAKSTKAKNVPIVVPNEAENGPDNYGLNAKAEVTIIIANKSKVSANVAVASAKDLDIDAVVASVKESLK